MLDGLVNELKEKVGLTDEQAQKAAAVAQQYLANSITGDQVSDVAGKVGLGEHAEKIGDAADGILGRFKKKD